MPWPRYWGAYQGDSIDERLQAFFKVGRGQKARFGKRHSDGVRTRHASQAGSMRGGAAACGLQHLVPSIAARLHEGREGGREGVNRVACTAPTALPRTLQEHISGLEFVDASSLPYPRYQRALSPTKGKLVRPWAVAVLPHASLLCVPSHHAALEPPQAAALCPLPAHSCGRAVGMRSLPDCPPALSGCPQGAAYNGWKVKAFALYSAPFREVRAEGGLLRCLQENYI